MNSRGSKFNGVEATIVSMNRTDGQPLEFEWKIFQGLTTMGVLNDIQQMTEKLHCEPENYTGKITFISMFNEIVWDANGNDEQSENNSKTIKKYARRFPRGHWSFMEPGSLETELKIKKAAGIRIPLPWRRERRTKGEWGQVNTL